MNRKKVEETDPLIWRVQTPGRLLTEIKNKFLNLFSVKDLRWSIEYGRCFVNGLCELFPSYKLRKGDQLMFFPCTPPLFSLEPERLLFEDECLIAYDKPPYLTTEHLGRLLKAHLVHRLDRDTSGIILFAKESQGQKLIENVFKNREIQKEYLAWVEGTIGDQGIIEGNMRAIHRREGAVIWGLAPDGVWSTTVWKRIEKSKGKSLVLLRPETGRTHQLRVHMKSIGHPILGDRTYGSRHYQKGIFRPLLHARSLEFKHPFSQRLLKLRAPFPKDFGIEENQFPV